jgi:ribose transport system substrate-binding protein
MITSCFLRSNSFNDFRVSGQKRVVVSAILFGVLFAGAQPTCRALTLGYSAGYLTDPFQAIEVNKTIEAAKQAGMKTLPVTNANGDAGKQVTDIHNLVGEGAQAILVMPADSEAIVPALSFASTKQVPVVAIDNATAGGKAFMIVRANNIKMGEDAAAAVAKALNGKGTVLSLMGDQATAAGRERSEGFDNYIKKNFREIRIIEQPTYWKTDKAVAAAQTIVSSTPTLGAIYMQSDSVMLAGVLNVLKSANKLTKVGDAKHIFLISIDGTPLALQKIREGWLDALISQPVDLYVKYGLSYVQAAVDGKKFDTGPTDHQSEIIDYQGSPVDLLPARVVTQAEAGDDTLWGNQAK